MYKPFTTVKRAFRILRAKMLLGANLWLRPQTAEINGVILSLVRTKLCSLDTKLLGELVAQNPVRTQMSPETVEVVNQF